MNTLFQCPSTEIIQEIAMHRVAIHKPIHRVIGKPRQSTQGIVSSINVEHISLEKKKKKNTQVEIGQECLICNHVSKVAFFKDTSDKLNLMIMNC